jgi:hypothetical protein
MKHSYVYRVNGFIISIFEYKFCHIRGVRPDNAVGIATCYGLDDPGIESRWGSRFSGRVQAGHGIHSTTYTVGTGSFSG